MTVKCSCHDSQCKKCVWLEQSGSNAALLWFQIDRIGNPEPASMYMDANSIVALVQDLRAMLLSMTEVQT